MASFSHFLLGRTQKGIRECHGSFHLLGGTQQAIEATQEAGVQGGLGLVVVARDDIAYTEKGRGLSGGRLVPDERRGRRSRVFQAVLKKPVEVGDVARARSGENASELKTKLKT